MKQTLTDGTEYSLNTYCPYCHGYTPEHLPGCPYVHIQLYNENKPKIWIYGVD
jgi:hypothetical protein